MKSWKSWFTKLMEKTETLCQESKKRIDLETSSPENEKTKNLVKIAEATNELGWKIVFLTDENYEPRAVYAAPEEEIEQLKALIMFDNGFDDGGISH